MSECVNDLGFNVPATSRSYGDNTSVKSLIRKIKKAGGDLAIPGLVYYTAARLVSEYR